MNASPPSESKHLFAYLDKLGIAHSTVWHQPIFTVEEGRDLKSSIAGGHTKNLFLKDKNDALVLIAAEANTQIKLNQLHKLIGTRRLSFAKPELMRDVLGVSPGSVTAFALMNDTDVRVRFFVDAELMKLDPINFHPMINTGTTAISREDFKRFVLSTEHDFEVVDFSGL